MEKETPYPAATMGKIIVVNKYKESNYIYIGRGSPLGNPYLMKNNSDEERARVLELFEPWLIEKIREKDPAVMAALNRILDILKRGEDVKLGCFCAPKPCHGDIIKRFICTRYQQGLL